jgi:hypothetical protein
MKEPEYDPTGRPVWEEILEIGASIPHEVWETVPTDLSINLDHYLYGAPKEDVQTGNGGSVMTQTIRENITVEQEGVIEIHNPALSVGTKAEVIVHVEKPPVEEQPLVSFLGRGKGCFTDAAEVDAFLRAERESWDR